MKKIILLLTITPIIAFANLNIEKVTSTLSHITGKKTLSFFSSSSNFATNGKLKFTSLAKADIILFPKKKYNSKMIIVDSYKKLKLNKNSIGAVYLKKGRTQIIFVQERLDSNGLILNPKFKKHILHEWQLNPQKLIDGLK
ncbi:MAG: Unknown protein [uncultured Sulfurovum sp.]|uniref:Uncharacterized protein n=1 Tax=uncultured Sulfurovum sp. TaxID=269237 RepID=A0A6S6TZB5_9BACT|nr:MAG: Unknown protein [uncultured Sulfurovum sp.]